MYFEQCSNNTRKTVLRAVYSFHIFKSTLSGNPLQTLSLFYFYIACFYDFNAIVLPFVFLTLLTDFPLCYIRLHGLRTSNLIVIPSASYLTFLSVSLSFSLSPKAFKLFSLFPRILNVIMMSLCVEFCFLFCSLKWHSWANSKWKNMFFISRKLSHCFDDFFVFFLMSFWNFSH